MTTEHDRDDEDLDEGYGEELFDGVCIRVVNDDAESRRYLVAGMEAFDLSDLGYPGMYGVHCGDPDEWLPVLYNDNYITGDVLVFELDLDAWNHQHPEASFFWMPDPHPIDLEEAPSSYIIFSRLPFIPAEIVKLVREVPECELLEMLKEAYEEGDMLLEEAPGTYWDDAGVLRHSDSDEPVLDWLE